MSPIKCTLLSIGAAVPLLGVFAVPAKAQAPVQQQSQQSQESTDQEKTSTEQLPSAETKPPTIYDTSPATGAPDIRAMNSAGALPSGRVSPAQLGPVYLQGVSFFQSGQGITVSGAPGTTWESISLFRANIVFDQVFKTSRFAVQYQPRLTVVNGDVSTDTSNLNANWTTGLYRSPRLDISVDNGLNYFGQQGQFDNLSLLADFATGNLVQSRFLEGSGHFLSDRTELPIKFLISPRSRLEITPFYEYYKASGTASISESRSPGASLTYGYALSSTRGIGLGYSVRDTDFSSRVPRTTYQTMSVSYSQILAPTLRFSTSAGAALSTATLNGIRSTQSTVTATFNVIKSLQASSFAFNYYRGQATGLQITNGFADRYDLAYERRLSQRTHLSASGGYYREFLAITNTSGYYFSGALGYSLNQHWSVQGQYAYKHQINGGQTFATGDLQYLAIGLKWDSGRAGGYY